MSNKTTIKTKQEAIDCANDRTRVLMVRGFGFSDDIVASINDKEVIYCNDTRIDMTALERGTYYSVPAQVQEKDNGLRNNLEPFQCVALLNSVGIDAVITVENAPKLYEAIVHAIHQGKLSLALVEAMETTQDRAQHAARSSQASLQDYKAVMSAKLVIERKLTVSRTFAENETTRFVEVSRKLALEHKHTLRVKTAIMAALDTH